MSNRQQQRKIQAALPDGGRRVGEDIGNSATGMSKQRGANLRGMEEENPEIPVNEVDVVTNSQFIVEDCSICGDTHYHGSVENLSVGESTERAAHCGGSIKTYSLTVTEQTEWK